MASSTAKTDFFPQFWRLLRDNGIEYRHHWGKYLATRQLGAAGVANAFRAGWRGWHETRERFDPHQIFVTAYWRYHLDGARRHDLDDGRRHCDHDDRTTGHDDYGHLVCDRGPVPSDRSESR